MQQREGVSRCRSACFCKDMTVAVPAVPVMRERLYACRPQLLLFMAAVFMTCCCRAVVCCAERSCCCHPPPAGGHDPHQRGPGTHAPAHRGERPPITKQHTCAHSPKLARGLYLLRAFCRGSSVLMCVCVGGAAAVLPGD